MAKRRMETEIAPKGCIVCQKKHPGHQGAPGWTYLAGATPVGSMGCSTACTKIAVDRFYKTGRCDGKRRENTGRGLPS